MFTLKIAVLVASLHHHPVERHFWMTFPTRFTCEHAESVVERNAAKVVKGCTRTTDRT